MNQQPSYRQQKVANVLIKALAKVVDEKRGFMRLPFITINHIKMSADLKIANIYISFYVTDESATSDDNTKKIYRDWVMETLNAHAKILRREISDKVYLKSIPELRFHHDSLLQEANKIINIIDSIKHQ